MWAATDYQICAYAENIYGNWSAGSVEYFTTTAIDSNYKWEVKATSTNTATTSADTIRDIVSEQQGVNPARNIDAAVAHATTGGRRLQDNEYTYTATLVAARNSNVTALSLSTLSATQQAQVYADIVTVLGPSFTASGYTPT